MKRRAFLLFGALAPLTQALGCASLLAPDSEATAYFEWARSQARAHREQLEVITCGADVELFIAHQQAETVRELARINFAIQRWRVA